MKTILLSTFFALVALSAGAQCQAFTSVQPCTCYGACNGMAVVADIGSGTPPYSYTWMPGGMTTQSVTGLCAGTYTVVMVDSLGCASTAIANVTQPAQLSVNPATSDASCGSCCDGMIWCTPTGGTAGYSYQWYPSGGPGSVTDSLCPGLYVLCVTDAMGCMDCDTIQLSFPFGIADGAGIGGLEVFPNPASGKVTVRQAFSAPVAAEIRLTNVLGETVFIHRTNASAQLSEDLNVSGLAPGVYIVTVETENGVSTRKLEIE